MLCSGSSFAFLYQECAATLRIIKYIEIEMQLKPHEIAHIYLMKHGAFRYHKLGFKFPKKSLY